MNSSPTNTDPDRPATPPVEPLDSPPTGPSPRLEPIPLDPDPDEMLRQLEFMSNRLRRWTKSSASSCDEDLARRLMFAKCWIDSAAFRLKTDLRRELEELEAMSNEQVRQ